MITGDSWTSIALALSEPAYDKEGERMVYFDTGAAFFLGSFVVVVGWVLFNVVVAVMLEGVKIFFFKVSVSVIPHYLAALLPDSL